ncbi:hypothetical protein ACTFIW_011012 [Dictyostelium discoideum]
MSTNKKIKIDNNNKIFQDIIDFEILRSIINYLLISKKNKTNNNNNNNNNNNTINQFYINKFYLNRNEILNYILVSKKWYNFISLTISNNIINNNLFEHWLKINYYNNNNNNKFIENYINQNQNQYDKNKIVYKNKMEKQYKTSFNKEFSIIKIKESIINDYFKFNLFLDIITFDDIKEIKNKFENNQLVYNRIVVNSQTGNIGNIEGFSIDESILFTIHEYISYENSEIISNLFKILELNYDFWLPDGFSPDSEEDEEEDDDEDDDDDDDDDDKKCTELYFNNLSIAGYIGSTDYYDGETVKIFKNFKGKNIFFDGSNDESSQSRVNYSALFDPDNSGQQVESIKVQSKNYEINENDFVEPLHLIKVNQFENLHSIKVPINSLLNIIKLI